MRRNTKNRIGAPLLAVSVILALALLLAPLLQAAALAAPGKPKVQIALSKDAYWYRPGDTVRLQVTLNNETEQTLEGVSVRARVHSANKTRSDMDAAFEGDPVRSYRLTETLGRDLSLSPGNNGFKFDLPIPSHSFSDGVYPLTVEAMGSGDVITKAIGELIVMDPEEAEGFTPLKLSMVFDLSEPPHLGPDGKFDDDELAEECSASGKEPGWFRSIESEVEKWKDLRFTFSLSPVILEEMLDMADGYVVRKGEKEISVGSDSASATDVAVVVSGFQEMAASPRIQFLSTPFASPNLETLVTLDWAKDARQQISMGDKTLEEGLESAMDAESLHPPGLKANSQVVGELKADSGRFLLLSGQLLKRTSQGRKLSTGLSLGSPVEIAGAGYGRQVLGLFADARLEKVIGLVGPSGDPHGVAQCILSDLTNLYLERPARTRACVLLWPNWWRPSARILDEILKAVHSSPWLESVTLGECWAAVPPIEDTVLEIPGPDLEEDDYFTQVGYARNRYHDYSGIALPDNPILPSLERNLFISESDLWRQSGREARGLEYAESVIRTIDGELAKVGIPAMGSVTLTSEKAEVPFSIINGTSYKIKAVLKFSSNGLSFPDGDSLDVILEPKENLFEVPVVANKKGKVRFTARLETDRIVLAELNIPVRTSRFNTFAIILVGGLLGLIALIWVLKIAARRKVGKHKKHQFSRANNKEETEAGS
ncbi:MAG: hypothetical protein L6427_03900 [Actinomycetia bacterium]|nr:hypothetical protein [Actinomycetes bacterium]